MLKNYTECGCFNRSEDSILKIFNNYFRSRIAETKNNKVELCGSGLNCVSLNGNLIEKDSMYKLIFVDGKKSICGYNINYLSSLMQRNNNLKCFGNIITSDIRVDAANLRNEDKRDPSSTDQKYFLIERPLAPVTLFSYLRFL